MASDASGGSSPPVDPDVAQFPTTINLAWPLRLRFKRGSRTLLCGVDIYYDFQWSLVIGHQRGAFKNGKHLAKMARDDCPSAQHPVILLTTRDDVSERPITSGPYFIVVINIENPVRL